MKTGPRDCSKSDGLGGASLYLRGAISPGPASLCTFRSGVDRELTSGTIAAAPLDSLFFNESFFARFSREMATWPSSFGAWTWTRCVGLTSGLSGEDTAGLWSSSRTRFCGSTNGKAIPEDVGSLCGEPPSVAILYVSRLVSEEPQLSDQKARIVEEKSKLETLRQMTKHDELAGINGAISKEDWRI